MIGFPLSEDKLEEKRIASLLWQSYPILVSELWDSAEKQSRGACIQTHTNSVAKSTHICVSARVFYSAYFSIMQKNLICCLLFKNSSISIIYCWKSWQKMEAIFSKTQLSRA